MGESTAANVTLNGNNGAVATVRSIPTADRLQRELGASSLSLSDMLEEVESALGKVEFPAPSGAERLAEAARYALLGGGKRVRPILVMACAQALGVPVDRVMQTACAIELIHTNSLIVDDLPAMDNHAKRRGRPTLHRLYGDDIAILAGCALLSEAQRLILEDQPGAAELRNRLLREVLEATGTAGMVGGQFLDVTKYRPSDRDDLERMQMLKTGSLILACVRCGTLLADNRTYRAFDRFAESLGSLFQVVDDILDETGKARWLGKIPGSDRRAGKLTHVTMFGLRTARERAKELHEDCLASLEEIASTVPGPVGPLREMADMVYRREK
ncbi:MAG TPA: polyprenyl synthetase family protein [Solirubrobacterales bacterium]|nr:polyprenyl synthetase family protein [Solirubrobacterales bacterium]